MKIRYVQAFFFGVVSIVVLTGLFILAVWMGSSRYSSEKIPTEFTPVAYISSDKKTLYFSFEGALEGLYQFRSDRYNHEKISALPAGAMTATPDEIKNICDYCFTGSYGLDTALSRLVIHGEDTYLLSGESSQKGLYSVRVFGDQVYVGLQIAGNHAGSDYKAVYKVSEERQAQYSEAWSREIRLD